MFVSFLVMPLYAFQCSDCGPFDVQLAVGTAGEGRGCPDCGATARRRWGVPSLKATSAGAQASAIDERSRHAPERVSSPTVVGHSRPLHGGSDHAHGGGHSHAGHSHVHASPGRPWQVSH